MNIVINVPATSANLGPGFDALGLALDLWNRTSIMPAGEFAVSVQGEGARRLAAGKNNLIVRAAQKLAERAGKPLPPFRAECANQIPLSSGMGSSSAAILTGLLAANTLLENRFSRDEILNLASEMEGHPDNVAPALLGGLVVSTLHGGKVIARKIPIMDEQGGDTSPGGHPSTRLRQSGQVADPPLHIIIALPDFYLPTKQARAALPKKVSMRNAVHNISRTALVVEALRTGDMDLLGKVMTDRLHQPYRLKLIPGAASAMGAATHAGAAAVALSGAGPGVIAFASKIESGIPQGDTIGESMKRAFNEAGLKARIFNLRVSSRGAEIQES